MPVIQAFAEGKDIQYRYPNEQWEWETCRPPGCLEFTEAHEYRIKPEPRRFWVTLNKKTGYVSAAKHDGFMPRVDGFPDEFELIEVVEVMNER